jgi:hypothetical protein
MPKLTQTVEPTVATEVELSPELRAQLKQEFAIYQGLEEELEDTKGCLDAQKALLSSLREEAGEKSVGFDGFHVTLVSGGLTKSLDKKKLYALGITAKQLESCYVHKPKKSYELVTTPNAERKAKLAAEHKAAAKKNAPRDERDVEEMSDYDEA